MIGSPSGRNLVVEEVLLGREVVEDRLLGHAGFCRDVADGYFLEAARCEEPHRRIGDVLVRGGLLRLSEAHAHSVTI
jgi:hypothetical protein